MLIEPEKNGKMGEKKAKTLDTGHTGQRERRGSERPTLGHSPLGSLGENATAHYMLCLSSVDEQCAITLPCCSSSLTAACLWGAWYCSYNGRPAKSLCAHQTAIHALPNANPGLCQETKELYEFVPVKGEKIQERWLRHWREHNKGIMQHLWEQHNDVCSLLSLLPSLNSLKR